jgi:hypothetical protein
MSTPKLCSVEACGKPVHARGLCGMHYMRLRASGTATFRHHKAPARTPEQIAFVDRFLEGDECGLWPFGKNTTGYGIISLDGKQMLASRYACERVNGPPPTPKHEAAHLCGNGHLGCVTGKHLVWKTRTENQADRVKHGTTNRGERQGQSKLKEADVRAIRELLANGVPPMRIGAQFGVSDAAIYRIRNGDNWSWLK